MSRNTSGAYNLPVAAFVAGTAVVASDMNSNLTDIATALTGSYPLDGSTPMTGHFLAFAGSPSAPSYQFANSLGLGLYLNATESGFAFVAASVSIALFTSASSTNSYASYWVGNVSITGSTYIGSDISILGGIDTSVSINGDLVVYTGLVVGFSGTAVADRIQVGTASTFWDNDGSTPYYQGDTNDIFRYNRSSNRWDFEVGGTDIAQVGASVVFYNGLISLPEITASVTVSSGYGVVYARDDSGVSKVYFKDDNQAEYALGGPYWEQISVLSVTNSVASLTLALTKQYSRLVIAGCSISGTTTSSRQLIVEVSDDGGGSYQAIVGQAFGGNSGSITGNNITASGPMYADTIASVTEDMAFFMEFIGTHYQATSKPFWGQLNSRTGGQSFFAAGQTTVVMNDVDSIRIRWSTGTLLDAGTIVVYGEVQR